MCFCDLPRRSWTAWRRSTTKRSRHLFVFRQNKLHGHCSVIAAAFFPFILKVLAGFPKIYLLWMYSSGKSSVNERVISSGADYIASGVKLTELGSVGILISNDRLVRSGIIGNDAANDLVTPQSMTTGKTWHTSAALWRVIIVKVQRL